MPTSGRNKFIIWYHDISCLQNWKQAHLHTQNKSEQSASKDTAMLSFCSPLRAHNNMMHAAAPRAISALAISEGRGTKSNLVTTKPHCLLCFCAPGRKQLREGTSWAQEASPRCTPVQGDLPRLGTHFPYPDRKQSEISKKFVAK